MVAQQFYMQGVGGNLPARTSGITECLDTQDNRRKIEMFDVAGALRNEYLRSISNIFFDELFPNCFGPTLRVTCEAIQIETSGLGFRKRLIQFHNLAVWGYESVVRV